MPRIDNRLTELAAGPGRPSDRGLDPTSQECLQKFQKEISSRTGDIPLSNFGKEVSKKAD